MNEYGLQRWHILLRIRNLLIKVSVFTVYIFINFGKIMKKFLSYGLFNTLILGGIAISGTVFANHHDAGDSNCKGMDGASFSISGLDTDNDKNVSLDEYLKGDPANTEKKFKHMDANQDSKLDVAEQKDIEAVYKKMHENHKAKANTI